MTDAAPVGLLGGSGFYGMPEMEVLEELRIDTPFGEPSGFLARGAFNGVDVAFIARHGRGHTLPPHAINYRANIFALKAAGVQSLLSLSAVGSMHQDYHPMDLALPAQIFDRTTGRRSTFFDGSPVVHVSMADPVCPELAGIVIKSGKKLGATVHEGGTYLCMNGPAFSTRAESNVYRSWGVDVIGMTSATEAKLAREAEICYVTLCMITDYDVWKESEQDVTGKRILENMRVAAETAAAIVAEALPRIADASKACSCGSALDGAIMSDPAQVARVTRERLAPLLGKYFPADR